MPDSPTMNRVTPVYLCALSANAAHSELAKTRPGWTTEHEGRSSPITPAGDESTEEEAQNLHHMSDHIPLTLTERFTYYVINSPFRKFSGESDNLRFVKHRIDYNKKLRKTPLDDAFRPGALGLGQARASKMNCAFPFIIFLSPIGWAILADTSIGRYETICIAIS